MSDNQRPLVSAITGTWQRPDMIMELIENLRAQTYRPLEHVIVSDGPDPELRALLEPELAKTDVPIIFQECGRWWSGFLANSISAVPFQVAQWLAHGDVYMWCADDERFTTDHVEKLMDLMERERADFVYPLQGCYRRGAVSRHLSWIGTPTPQYGQITHALYRAELLDYRGFEVNVGSGTDWDQVKHWMRAGARWAFLPEKTFTHRVDKSGDGDARRTRQPLRGHTAFGSHPARSASPPAATDCMLCGGDTGRVCWCHGSQGGSDNRPCRCSGTGIGP